MTQTTILTLDQIRDVILDNFGEAARIAANMKPPVSRVHVHKVLYGQTTSQPVLDACHARAVQLLKIRKEAEQPA